MHAKDFTRRFPVGRMSRRGYAYRALQYNNLMNGWRFLAAVHSARQYISYDTCPWPSRNGHVSVIGGDVVHTAENRDGK